MPEWKENLVDCFELAYSNSGEAAVDVMAHFLGMCSEHSKLTRRWALNEQRNSMEVKITMVLQNPVLTNRISYYCYLWPFNMH